MAPSQIPSTQRRSVWLVNLFFGPGLAPTGVLLESLAIDLRDRDWQVEVLTGSAEYRSETSGQISSFSGIVHRFRCQSKRSGLRGKFLTWVWFYVQVVWFSLWRRMPDAIVVQTTPPFLHTLFAVRSVFSWHRPRLILWNQDTYPETLVATAILREKSLAYRLLKGIAFWSGRRVHQAVALDGAMAARLSNQGIKNVRVIANWDLKSDERSELPLDVNSVTPAEAALNLPEELIALASGYRFKVAYTGNLGLGHDLSPIWDYISRYPRQTDFVFLFIGEGDRTKQLKARVQQAGWDCVKFWSYLPSSEFNSLLNWADFGLVALDTNCLGLMSPSKMHAWLGAGKPILYIGPEGSNVTETIRAYECGFIVDPLQAQSFDTVAEVIRNDPLHLKSIQSRAQRAWKERHAPEVGLRAWREIFEL